MNLMQAKTNNSYKIQEINIDDIEVESFLFSLGIYEGEDILLLNKNSSNFTIFVKGSRYNIDKNLAQKILIYD